MIRRRCKTGEERDVHNYRRFLMFRSGEVAAVKQRTNRRERREGKNEIRNESGSVTMSEPTFGQVMSMTPEEWERMNRSIAAELLAWAALLDTPGGPGQSTYPTLADDLRCRAYTLSPSNPDDQVEIEARLAELRGER